MKRLVASSFVVALAALSADVAYAQVPPGVPGGGREQVPFTSITRRVAGGPTIPGRMIITSQEAYSRFFKTDMAAPCDFAREYLAIIHLGTIGSKGFGVRVTSVERVYGSTTGGPRGLTTGPNVLTINYQITKEEGAASGQVVPLDRGQPAEPQGDRLPGEGELSAPCEVIKIAIPARPEQTRFFEVGGEDRAGFNAIARTLTGGAGFQNHMVEFDGTVRAPGGNRDEKRQTRLTMAELERLSLAVRNAQLATLPKTIPTEALDAQRFRYSLFDARKKRTVIEGARLYEGQYSDKLRPLDEAFEVALSRIERRPVRIEGVVERSEQADAIRIQSALGLVYDLRGPLARILTNFAGKKVLLSAVVQLRTADLAEGAVDTITYPQRAPRSGTVLARGGLSMQLLDRTGAAPGPVVKLIGDRSADLCGPEAGNTVLIDAYWFFDEKTRLPSEACVEAIRAITIAPVELRSAAEQPNDFVAELGLRTSVWVTNRKGGAQGVAYVAGQKSGWCPSQFLRFTYTPPTTQGLRDLLDEESARAEARWKVWKEEYDRRRAASGSTPR